MPYPTPGDYQDALQFPETAFSDPALVAGTPVAGPLGLPQPITGAFAAVFPVETARGRVAVRCFLTDVPALRRRYRAVAEALAEAALPYTVAFEYQPAGVEVEGRAYPLVVMDWAEGETLGRWVARRHAEAGRVEALAEAWRRMLAALEAHGLAHGDLQHGNVLVAEDEDGALRLTLVDYDAFVVPALYDRPAPEVGHRNYQHPDRTDRDAGPHLDRFPGLVVYTALRALAAEPALWDRYGTDENLLFVADDFFAPDASPLFADVRRIDAVRPLAEALRTACFLPPDRLPPLDDVLAGAMPDAEARTRPSHEEAGNRIRRERFAQMFLPAVLVLAAVCVGLLALGQSVLAILLSGLGGVVVAAAVSGSYRRLSVVRRRRRLAGEAEVLARWADELDAEARRLDEERRRVEGGTEEARAERLEELREEALGRHLRRHFVGELDAEEAVGHRVVIRLKVAGIRDAAMATPERVSRVQGVTSERRAAVDAWRAALVERYADAAPEALSPSEEQRLRRRLRRQLDALDREAARLRAKARVQREERAHVLARLDALPPLSPWTYLRYLFRLGPLPAARRAPTPRRGARKAGGSAPREGDWWEDV